MSFGERIKFRRGELKLSRGELAGRLGVSPSAVSNYENGLSFPKEDVMLRLFDSLETDPNQLFRDSFRGGGQALSSEEQTLLRKFRELSPLGRETVQSVTEALWACRQETSPLPAERPEGRIIPLYHTLAAVGCVSAVPGEDFDEISVTEQVPQTAEFAVRISGDAMAPYLEDGAVAYVSRTPLREGDVGIFSVNGKVLCRQYDRDDSGTVHLFSLNRRRADGDVTLPCSGGRDADLLWPSAYRDPVKPKLNGTSCTGADQNKNLPSARWGIHPKIEDKNPLRETA